jgi:hypothetical protein
VSEPSLNDLKEEVWKLVVLLRQRDPELSFRYDRILRDLENEYVELSAWEEVRSELEDLTLF